MTCVVAKAAAVRDPSDCRENGPTAADMSLAGKNVGCSVLGQDERVGMPVTMATPSALKQYTEKKDTVEVETKTVAEALSTVVVQCDALRKHLFAEDGKLRSFVNLYRNDEDIHFLQRGGTRLKEDDILSSVPSIAGDCVREMLCT